MSNILINLVWKGKSLKPFLRYVPLNGSEHIDLPLDIGSQINLQIEGENYCIGTDHRRGTWLSCVANQIRLDLKNNNEYIPIGKINNEESQQQRVGGRNIDLSNYSPVKLSDKSLQCSNCEASEYFTCRITCRGDVCVPTSNRAEELCNPPNTSVYLTYVGGELKVGVSLGIPRRWVEQASDLAVVVAKAPGLEARRIEHEAAELLDLRLQVRNKKKIDRLSTIDTIKMRKELEEKIKQIQPIIHRVLKDVAGKKIENPTIRSFENYYGKTIFSRPVQSVKVSKGKEFGGKIVTVKGSIIIAENKGYYFALDVRKLQGKTFRFMKKRAKIEAQSHLDEWF